MFTRCPGCHTVHPVNAALLARGGGRFRCGKCKKVCNALEALFDDWPDPGDSPVRPGGLPELGSPLQLEPAGEEVPAGAMDESEDSAAAAQIASRRLLRVVWVTAAAVVTLFVLLNLARYFGVSLLDRPGFQSLLQRSGLQSAPPAPPFRDLDRIEIVAREMIPHPRRPGTLVLNLTLVNRADRFQPYPDIEASLLDLENRVVAMHRFRPGDYLTRTADWRRGMTPGAYVGLSLELPDPGVDAAGFELQFQ